MEAGILKLKVKRSRRNNPCYTLRQIGEQYGVTRERVRQILKEEGLRTKAVGTLYYKTSNPRFCLNCGKVRLDSRKNFCSRKCQKEYLTIQVACTQCDTLFPLLQGAVKTRVKNYKNIFCSHSCSIKYYHTRRTNKVESDK